MEYQYGQNNDNEQRDNAWNNEWSNPYQQSGAGSGTNGNGTNGNGTNGMNGNGSGNGDGGDHNHKKNKKWLVAIALVAMLLIGVAVGLFGSGALTGGKNTTASAQETKNSVGLQTKEAAAKSGTTSKAGSSSTTASGSAMTVAQIASNCLPSIVAITNKGETEIRSMWGTFTQQSESAGSGVIIGETAKELLIVTNYHVVEGNESLSVLFSYQENSKNSEIAKAKVKDYDENKDIAVVTIDKSTLSAETLKNIKVATIGDSSKLVLGDQVVAIGNALGYGQSVTTGIVSALDRTVDLQSEDGTALNNKYIQTDAAINPGNSGGGLFNLYGQLVGINSAKVSSEEVEGMGYSIPVSSVKADIETMMNAETRDVVATSARGYLGIQGSNVTSDINQAYGIPEGVYISSVSKGSPAETAGLQKGMVITGLNGKTISTIEALKSYLSYYKAGEKVTLTVNVQSTSGYTSKSVGVTLGTQSEAGISSQEETQSSSESQDQESQQDQQNQQGQQGQQGQGNSGETQDPYSQFYNYFNQQGQGSNGN